MLVMTETKTQPSQGIPCLVLDRMNRPMKYDPINKVLYYAGPRDFTEFPTKKAAKHAVWHQTVADRQAGIKDADKNYIVEEM